MRCPKCGMFEARKNPQIAEPCSFCEYPFAITNIVDDVLGEPFDKKRKDNGKKNYPKRMQTNNSNNNSEGKFEVYRNAIIFIVIYVIFITMYQHGGTLHNASDLTAGLIMAFGTFVTAIILNGYPYESFFRQSFSNALGALFASFFVFMITFIIVRLLIGFLGLVFGPYA